jgi:4-diphosphocytidyl-2-C-methyl-D-erythritol kinase
MSVRVFAPAKINLTIEVGAPRADGLHPLQSIVTFADVGDVVEAQEAETLSLTIKGEFAADLSVDDDNLVLRAARALAAAASITSPGAALTLEKDLPVASGIGGGSADAAATLHALNALWDLGYDTRRLSEIARPLGADVPICVAGAPAYMTGAGETWAALALPSFAAVLVNPLKPLPTPDVYRRFDTMKLGASFAERAAPDLSSPAAALAAIAASGNDLDAPARALMPELDAVTAALRADARARVVGLSGSGATMFALVDSSDATAAMAEDIQKAHPEWWVCETILAGA